MKHKVFIPVTDEMLYEHPELITAPLRPYQMDNPCFHWMATIESPEKSANDPCVNMRFDHRSSLVAVNPSSVSNSLVVHPASRTNRTADLQTSSRLA